MLNKRTIPLLLFCFFSQLIFSQARLSVSTDLSLQRSFKKQQQFWAIGQNVVFDIHVNETNGIYFSICYYSDGKFKNALTADAKSPATTPQQIQFTNSAVLRLKQISMGVKHYIVGGNKIEEGWSLYGLAGFGLIFGKATNTYSRSVDTALYTVPERPLSGVGHFKRLTFDVALGWEAPLGADVYFYTEGKVWIPTTEYPSKYLFINNNAPLTGLLGAGIRILF